MGAVKTKGFAKTPNEKAPLLYSFHLSHDVQGSFSLKFSVPDARNWDDRHRKAIAIARLIAEYLNTPDEARLFFLRDALGDVADQLIPLTDDSGSAWAGFVGLLKFPPGSPKFRQPDGAIVDAMTLTTLGQQRDGWEVVDAEKEWRRLL